MGPPPRRSSRTRKRTAGRQLIEGPGSRRPGGAFRRRGVGNERSATSLSAVEDLVIRVERGRLQRQPWHGPAGALGSNPPRATSRPSPGLHRPVWRIQGLAVSDSRSAKRRSRLGARQFVGDETDREPIGLERGPVGVPAKALAAPMDQRGEQRPTRSVASPRPAGSCDASTQAHRIAQEGGSERRGGAEDGGQSETLTS